MRRALCWLLTGHKPERVEWRRVGQAERLFMVCLSCGRSQPLTPEAVRILAMRDFNMEGDEGELP